MERWLDASDPWPALKAISFALLAAGLAAVILIGAGAFDPRPLGPALHVAPPASLTVGPGETTSQPLQVALSPSFTLRGAAGLLDGEDDSAYGLRVGDGDAWLTVAVSPLGEVAIWEETADGAARTYVPWQPWPHVRRATGLNEVWIDVVEQGSLPQVTVRINRERLWQGETTVETGLAARWAGSFGAAAAIGFGATTVFSDAELPPERP